MNYINEIINKYQTSKNVGLTSTKAKEYLSNQGLNELKKEKKKSFLFTLLKQFNDPTIYLLLVAVILSLFLKEFIDVIIIMVVLIANSLIGAFQEYNAEKALDSLKKLSSPHANVLRDGKLVKIPINEVVLGDVVYLQEGDIVPSDLLLFDVNSLEIDESLLSGESLPVSKICEDKDLSSFSISERKNEVFMSTKVIRGNAKGVCIRRGMETEVGKIASMIDTNDNTKTPLQLRLANLSKFLGIITILIVVVVLLFALIKKYNIIEFLIFAISVAVAAVPEGLPAVVTIVLSLGVIKLVKVNSIVRKLPCVETLGSVDVVCSDKTGTLTENKLKVESIFFNLKEINNIEGTILEEAFVFNNNATLDIGDPLEIALNKYVKNYQELKKKCHRLKEIPFTSETKTMQVVCKLDNKTCLISKGAFEIIIDNCSFYYLNGREEKLSSNVRQQLINQVNLMTSKALKVIAFSYSYSLDSSNQVFLGIVGLIDPPRKNIEQSVKKLKDASITPIMITGDHIDTAFEIGKQVGICEKKEECLDVSKVNFDNVDIELYKVFARVSPSHKLKIVEYYQKKNHVVAMTGDGVNDSPALKKADVGIAMGISGSDVSKSSSDIILQDDNFQTIELAIEEGRNVFINIKKAILFLLSSNLGEVISILIFLFLNLPSPLISIHILWVNLISDSLPALALGSDEKYDDIMHNKPRKRNESLFHNNGLFVTLFYGVLIALITAIGYLIVPLSELHNLTMNISMTNLQLILHNQEILSKARTIAFSCLSLSEIFHMVGMSNIKANLIQIIKNKNTLRVIAFIVGVILQVMVVEIGFFNEIFNTVSLSLFEWFFVILLSVIPLFIHELLIKVYKTNL